MDIKEKQKKIPHLIETAEAPLRSAAQQLKDMTRLETLSAGLAAEPAQLDQKRSKAGALLDKTILVRYTKLKAARKELAVAPVRDGTCFGCRLQLPPQLVAEVKRSDQLQTCTYCQRILYWDGEPLTVPTTTPDSLENAADDMQETV